MLKKKKDIKRAAYAACQTWQDTMDLVQIDKN